MLTDAQQPRFNNMEFGVEIKISIYAYWHMRSNTYDKFPISRSEDEKKTAYCSVLKRFINGDKLKVLDVGTGTGFLALMLAQMGYDTIGLDLTEGMLEKARQKVAGNGYRVSFKLGDAENLPFDDASFDAIVCRYLLWTLPDPWRALSGWRRAIKPGGSIICIEGQWQNSSLKGRLKRLPFHNGLTPEDTIGLFQESGLTNITTETLSNVRNVQARNMPLFYRMAIPPPLFLIKGERRNKNARYERKN